MCCSNLLLLCFGAPTSLLHRSLLHPCHLVWPGWLSPGCCGPVARLVTVTKWHAALQLQPSSFSFKMMIGKLEVGDWPLSPRGQGWVLCQHGLSAEDSDSEERHWQTSESMTASGPDLSQKSESQNRPESESKNLRIKN
jgi:hypothetical protein